MPGSSIQHFAGAGASGTYIQDVPATAGPRPLVLDLHGYMEPAMVTRLGTGLGAFGDSHGFVTITPQLDEPGLPRWDFGEHGADIGYLSGLLTNVESRLCIDQRRVYVAGYSMGAFTASSLACRLSDRIAAIAAVAGLQDFGWCRPGRTVPVVAFHGTADPIVAYTGGPGPTARFFPAPDGSVRPGQDRPSGAQGPGPQSIPASAAAWSRRNGCGSDPVQRQIASDVRLTAYPCPHDGAVELYSIIGGGHTWPGSTFDLYPAPVVGATTHSISANQILWDFFQAHSLPTRH